MGCMSETWGSKAGKPTSLKSGLSTLESLVEVYDYMHGSASQCYTRTYAVDRIRNC